MDLRYCEYDGHMCFTWIFGSTCRMDFQEIKTTVVTIIGVLTIKKQLLKTTKKSEKRFFEADDRQVFNLKF